MLSRNPLLTRMQIEYPRSPQISARYYQSLLSVAFSLLSRHGHSLGSVGPIDRCGGSATVISFLTGPFILPREGARGSQRAGPSVSLFRRETSWAS